MLGKIAARNRFARLPLGICVSDAGRRNPAVSAQAAATMQLLTKGRFIFGIGPGEREGNEPYGVDWAKPVARFEEAMATIRALWNSNGELVNRDSPFFPLRNAIFDLPPYRGQVAADQGHRARPQDVAYRATATGSFPLSRTRPRAMPSGRTWCAGSRSCRAPRPHPSHRYRSAA